MPKQNNNAGLNKQGEKGGKDGTSKGGATAAEKRTPARVIFEAPSSTC